jgi:hypothetical protein
MSAAAMSDIWASWREAVRFTCEGRALTDCR